MFRGECIDQRDYVGVLQKSEDDGLRALDGLFIHVFVAMLGSQNEVLAKLKVILHSSQNMRWVSCRCDGLAWAN